MFLSEYVLSHRSLALSVEEICFRISHACLRVYFLFVFNILTCRIFTCKFSPQRGQSRDLSGFSVHVIYRVFIHGKCDCVVASLNGSRQQWYVCINYRVYRCNLIFYIFRIISVRVVNASVILLHYLPYLQSWLRFIRVEIFSQIATNLVKSACTF